MTITPTFPATITQDEKGRFLVHFQDIEEATGEGNSLEDALDNAREVLTQALESRIAEGLPPLKPKPANRGFIHFIAPAQSYIDKLKPKQKPLTWPRGGGGPHFDFPDEAKEKIVALLGEEHVQGVWIESLVYIHSKQYNSCKSVGDKNKELVKIKNHAEALLEIFSDQTTRNYLLNKAGEIWGDYVSLRLAKDPLSTFTSLKIIDDLKLIHMVCSVAILRDKPGRRGRPKGTASTPEYKFLNSLYDRCRKAYGKPLPLTPGKNLLAQLVDVLKDPLDIRGDLPSLVRKVIESHQKAKPR